MIIWHSWPPLRDGIEKSGANSNTKNCRRVSNERRLLSWSFKATQSVGNWKRRDINQEIQKIDKKIGRVLSLYGRHGSIRFCFFRIWTIFRSDGSEVSGKKYNNTIITIKIKVRKRKLLTNWKEKIGRILSTTRITQSPPSPSPC